MPPVSSLNCARSYASKSWRYSVFPGLPSRSDDLTVAVRLQPTGKGLDSRTASRQRRLMARWWGVATGLWALAIQPSLRDGTHTGRLHRGLKPPGYRRIPLRGNRPIGLGRNLSHAPSRFAPSKSLDGNSLVCLDKAMREVDLTRVTYVPNRALAKWKEPTRPPFFSGFPFWRQPR